MPDQIPTTVIGIVGAIVVTILSLAAIMVRGAVKAMADQARSERELRQQATKDSSDAMRSIQAALIQIVGFMATLTEQMRTVQTELIRAALREPLSKKVEVVNSHDRPVPPVSEAGGKK